MARFVFWCLRKNIKDKINNTVKNYTKTFYKGIEGEQNDIRIARNLALNFTGFFLFCSFMEDEGIITEVEVSTMLDDITKIIYQIRDRQIQTVRNEQGSNVFLNILSDLIGAGRVSIHNPNMTEKGNPIEPEDLKNMIGFYKDENDSNIYIIASIAYMEVC